jgi:hypothetical protein
MGDAVYVQGRAGALGTVAYTIWGYSAGAWAASGIQRFTNTAYGAVGIVGIFDTGLWVWAADLNSNTAVVPGTTYLGDNVAQYLQAEPFIDFRISADMASQSVSCAAGSGTGRFVFNRFTPPSSGGVVEGIYEFDCPSSNVHVTGCFRYP